MASDNTIGDGGGAARGRPRVRSAAAPLDELKVCPFLSSSFRGAGAAPSPNQSDLSSLNSPPASQPFGHSAGQRVGQSVGERRAANERAIASFPASRARASRIPRALGSRLSALGDLCALAKLAGCERGIPSMNLLACPRGVLQMSRQLAGYSATRLLGWQLCLATRAAHLSLELAAVGSALKWREKEFSKRPEQSRGSSFPAAGARATREPTTRVRSQSRASLITRRPPSD